MAFLTARTRNNKGELRLTIVKDTFEVIPDMNINITDLNNNGNTKQKHFFTNGYGGLAFKCTVLLKRSQAMTGPIKQIHEWFINQTPLMVATDAIDIPHGIDNTEWDAGLFIITKNPSRKQSSEHYTRWELEFTSYTPLNLVKWKNDNTAIKKALNKAKNAKEKAALKSLKVNAKIVMLAFCDIKVLKYSKKKKTVQCVKYLQQVLQLNKFYLKGKVDGWYGPDTQDAVSKFQKKNKLKSTGKVDNKTFTKLTNP